jgi:CheY-like chemotaxis protein
VNGPEALARLNASEPVDLLFSAILMPGGISGVALAAQARRIRRGGGVGWGVLLTPGYPAEGAST